MENGYTLSDGPLNELRGMIGRDFPSVRQITFFDRIVEKVTEPFCEGGSVYYLLADSSGELGTFEEGAYDAGGASIIAHRSIWVILPKCQTLERVVDTAIHEAAHVETKSETCDVPNRIASEKMPAYLAHLKTF